MSTGSGRMKSLRRVLVLLFVVASCSGESADDLFEKGEHATHDVKTYSEAVKHLSAFLEGYPDDPRADVAMQAIARVYQAQGSSDIAIATYKDLVTRFPKSRYADQAQFMVGYIYDLSGDREAAVKAYEAVIANFPESSLADDARISIKNINKPLEAWIGSEGKSD
jgi:TolA-binding protein